MIRETVVRNGNLRAEFFRNIWMVEKVRKNFDEDEIELFRKVYAEGKADGEFDIEDVDLVADITHYCITVSYTHLLYQRPRGALHLWPLGPWHDRRSQQTAGSQSGIWCLRKVRSQITPPILCTAFNTDNSCH